MNRIFYFLAITFFAVFSCKNESNKEETTAITTENAPVYGVNVNVSEAKLLAESKPDIVWLDVRTPEEVASGKIDGAMELDFNDPEFSKKISALHKEKEYIVYCAAGGRSAKAVELMQGMGFSKLHNLTEGYNGWSTQGK